MPIRHFAMRREDVPADAVNLVETTQEVADWENPGGTKVVPMWLWDTHVGLCIREREHNGYNDSDFYMTVWNEEKNAPETFMFATTRGWSYPCLASRVDATPEILAKFNAWEERQNRLARLCHKVRVRDAGRTIRAECGLTWAEFKRLRYAVGMFGSVTVIPEGYVKLLRSEHSGRLRSEFRKSLAAQVRAWLADPAPKYETPLSARQANYLFAD